MARQKKFPPPKEDVPLWFVTYTDMVTLLMTFFVLLMTFATMEPERFDTAGVPGAENFGASGRTGPISKSEAKSSWVARVRPPAARVALQGAEMPPITRSPTKEAFGRGLKALKPDEWNHNEIESHYFDIAFNQILDEEGHLTSLGEQILASLASQLDALPFQASLQFSDDSQSECVAQLVAYLIHHEIVRGGQIGMSVTRRSDLAPENLRFLIKRHLVKPL